LNPAGNPQTSRVDLRIPGFTKMIVGLGGVVVLNAVKYFWFRLLSPANVLYV